MWLLIAFYDNAAVSALIPVVSLFGSSRLLRVGIRFFRTILRRRPWLKARPPSFVVFLHARVLSKNMTMTEPRDRASVGMTTSRGVSVDRPSPSSTRRWGFGVPLHRDRRLLTLVTAADAKTAAICGCWAHF